MAGKSAVELLVDALELDSPNDVVVDEVLVPEQCMTITMGGKVYSVSVVELTDEDAADDALVGERSSVVREVDGSLDESEAADRGH